MLQAVLPKRFLFALIFIISFLPFSLWAQDVPKYGVFELTLTATGSYSNPYLQMPDNGTTAGFVVGNFTGPKGETISIDGFWDGGQTWKIRMSPTVAGTWTYTTSSSDSGLNGQTGSFQCIPSASHGFIRTHPENPFAFAYDDGTPFFWLGDSHVIFYSDTDFRFDDGTFQTYWNTRQSQGFTSIFFGTWLFKKRGNFAENEGGYNFNNSDPDQLNPTFWQWADKRVEYVTSMGIVPGIGIGWPDQKVDEFGDARLMRGLRYLIARYTAYNVMWCLYGEANERGSGWENWVRYFGNRLEKFDPYAHIASTHHQNRTAPAIGDDTWLDINIQQRDSGFVAEIEADRQKGKPVVNVEFNWDESYEVRRKSAWTIVTNGGHIGYGEERQLTSLGLTYMQYLGEFFREKTSYWKLQPHNDLLSNGEGYCLAYEDSEYVVYLPSGGNITIDLSATSSSDDFSVFWFDPKTGAKQLLGTNISGGQSQALSSPFSGDSVALLVRIIRDDLPPASPTSFRVIRTE